MEVKIGTVKLGLTNNGTSKVYIYPEGSDFSNTSEAIEVIGDLESLYAMTRKQGETLEIIENGKWKNLKIDQKYLEAFNSASYDRVKAMFKRCLVALNDSINGSRTELEFDTAKMLMTDNLDLFLRTQEYILELLKKSNTEFSKQVVEDIKSTLVDVKFNAWKIINDLTVRNIAEISKDYRIINGEEPKSDTKKK
jgi:hypothetical protein